MKRFIYYLLLIIALCFVSETKAQDNYIKFNYGGELNINDDLHCINHSLGLEFGYFFTNNSAFEIGYAHGFEKDCISFNRIGINYLYECNTSYYFAPYFKCGVGYKSYYIETDDYDYNIGGADFKVGFGVNAYLDENIALTFGVDLSNTSFAYKYNWHWDWKSMMFTPNIGLSYNF